MFKTHKSRWLAALASILTLTAAQTQAQSFPIQGKPVRIVVPYSAGGSTDSIARAVAVQLQQNWQVPVVVENRPGANSKIGSLEVMKAPPDGHTLLWSVTGMVQIPHLYSPPPWNLFKDFTPITATMLGGLALLVHESVPGKDFKEIMSYAKANTGKLAFASFGVGSSSHMYGDQLSRSMDLGLAHVPYKGTADAMNDVLSGRVQFFFDSVNTAIQSEKGGKVRIVAMATKDRAPQLPNIPTLREMGLPIGIIGFHGVFAPAGVAGDTADKIQRDIAAALAKPAITDLIVTNGSEPGGMSRAAFVDTLRQMDGEWATIISTSGIKLD
ncbi:tripartite tricarboxylate transporter substrate binding protein [soil metagenome]